MNFMQKVLYVMMTLCVTSNYASEYDSYNQVGRPSIEVESSVLSSNPYAQPGGSGIYPVFNNNTQIDDITVIEQWFSLNWQQLEGDRILTTQLTPVEYQKCYDYLQKSQSYLQVFATALEKKTQITLFLEQEEDSYNKQRKERIDTLCAMLVGWEEAVKQKAPYVFQQQQEEVAKPAIQQKEDSVEREETISLWQAIARDKHLQSLSQKVPSYVNKDSLIAFLVLALAAKCGALEGAIVLLKGGTSLIFSGLGFAVVPLGVAGQLFVCGSSIGLIALAMLSLKK